jgi:hypothetical protein
MDPRAALKRLDRRIGYRGTFLSFFALLDYLYGFSLIYPPDEAKRSPSARFLAEVIPLEAWGTIWILVAIILTIGVFAERDRWAFTAATGLKMLWGMTYLVGWALFHLDRGWVSAVIWLVLAAVMLRISGWPEPDGER